MSSKFNDFFVQFSFSLATGSVSFLRHLGSLAKALQYKQLEWKFHLSESASNIFRRVELKNFRLFIVVSSTNERMETRRNSITLLFFRTKKNFNFSKMKSKKKQLFFFNLGIFPSLVVSYSTVRDISFRQLFVFFVVCIWTGNFYFSRECPMWNL